MSVQNAIFSSWGQLDQQRVDTLLNPHHLPVSRMAADVYTLVEAIKEVPRFSSWLYLTKPPLIFNAQLSYSSNAIIGRSPFGRGNELQNYNPLWARVHSVVFVYFSKHHSDTTEYTNEHSFFYGTFDASWRMLASGEFTQVQADYSSFPRECHFILVGAEQKTLNPEQQTILEAGWAPVPKPLLVRLFPYIFG